jgi:uncharacterized membrane protein (DUF485 family)
LPKLDLRDPQQFIPREFFAAYVGPDSKNLLAYYDKARERGNPVVMSFNLLAILILPAWFGLHRLWVLWCTYTGLIGLVAFAERALGIEIPSGAFVGIGVAMGLMARGFLLTNANGLYLRLKRQGLDSSAIREALAGRARSSVPLAVAGGIGSAAVIVALAALAELVFSRAGR